MKEKNVPAHEIVQTPKEYLWMSECSKKGGKPELQNLKLVSAVWDLLASINCYSMPVLLVQNRAGHMMENTWYFSKHFGNEHRNIFGHNSSES